MSKRDDTANNVALDSLGNVLRDAHLGGDNINKLNFFVDGPAITTDPNFSDGGVTDPRKVATYWIWKFVNDQENDYAQWEWVGDYYPIGVTEGFTMKGIAGDLPISTQNNYVFRGKPNNVPNLVTEIVHTNFNGFLDANGNPRISLTGNPFPSAIDADLFIDDNATTIDGQLYFWDHWGGGSHEYAKYQGGYAIYTKSTGVPAVSHPDVSQTDGRLGADKKRPKQFIPIGQGFYVIQKNTYDAIAETYSDLGNGNVVFKNSQRIFKTEKDSLVSQFIKNKKSKKNIVEKEIEGGREIIRLNFTSPTGFTRQIAAVFMQGATDALDYGYDGYAGDFLPNDAFFIQDNRYLVINAFGEFDTTREIPISVFIDENGEGGLQKFSTFSIENLNGVKVYIKDKLNNGKTTEITNNTFEIQLEPGEYKDRFSVTFQPFLLPYSDLATLSDGFNIFMNNSQSEINIKRLSEIGIQEITLFNSLGQNIQSWSKGIDDYSLHLSVEESTGVYVVVLKTKVGSFSRKILIE